MTKINVHGLSAEQLTQFIERVERLESQKADISENIKLVFQEAKASGFNVKAMKEVIKLRKMSSDQIEEEEYMLDTYKRAMGMLPELDEDDSDSDSDSGGWVGDPIKKSEEDL